MGTLNHVQREANQELAVSKEFHSSPERALAAKVYDRRYLPFEIVGLSALGFANLFSSGWNIAPILVGILASGVGLYLKHSREESLIDAQTKRDEAQNELSEARVNNEDLVTRNNALQSGMASLLDAALENMATRMNLQNQERISVYYYRRQQRLLEGKARYSSNPDLGDFRRTSYQDTEGCIGKALREGESILESLPNPQTNLSGWQTTQFRAVGLETEKSGKMRMKARSIAAFAIQNGGTSRTGVVVVESKRTDVLSTDLIRKIVQAESQRLSEILELIGSHSQDAMSLAKAGY